MTAVIDWSALRPHKPVTGISDLTPGSRILLLLLPSTQEICDQSSPLRGFRGADGSFLARLTQLVCCRVINLSDTIPTLLLRLQIL